MPHSYRSCYYHLIFHTKRCSIRTEDVGALHAYMHGIMREKGCHTITIGGIENHVHILAEIPPNDVSPVINVVKSASTRWLKKRNAEAYHAFAWQSGSGQFTVSYSNTEKVRQYIKTQREHHQSLSARDEFIKFLVAHHIPYAPEDVDDFFDDV